jgi:hypothetical protein
MAEACASRTHHRHRRCRSPVLKICSPTSLLCGLNNLASRYVVLFGLNCATRHATMQPNMQPHAGGARNPSGHIFPIPCHSEPDSLPSNETPGAPQLNGAAANGWQMQPRSYRPGAGCALVNRVAGESYSQADSVVISHKPVPGQLRLGRPNIHNKFWVFRKASFRQPKNGAKLSVSTQVVLKVSVL